ncbi:MAG: DUF4190 domain-containing protein [Frankia sp.]
MTTQEQEQEQQPTPPPARRADPANGLGTASLVLGIIGITLCWVIVGAVAGIAAFVLGIIGRARVRRGDATNRGATTAGITLGALSTVIAALIVAGLWTFYAQHRHDIHDYQACKRAATTDQARSDCLTSFKNSLTGG